MHGTLWELNRSSVENAEENACIFPFFAFTVGAETGEENAFLTFFVFTVSAQTGT